MGRRRRECVRECVSSKEWSGVDRCQIHVPIRISAAQCGFSAVFVAAPCSAGPRNTTHPAQTLTPDGDARPQTVRTESANLINIITSRREMGNGELPAGGGNPPPGPRVDRSMHMRRSRPAPRRSTVGPRSAAGRHAGRTGSQPRPRLVHGLYVLVSNAGGGGMCRCFVVRDLLT